MVVAERLKHVRESRSMSQEKLAEMLGVESRQIISSIETGQRKVSAEELVRFSAIFDVGLDYFTDPYLIAGNGLFSWRQKGVEPTRLDAFEAKAGRWIGAYRSWCDQLGQNASALQKEVRLTRSSSFEDAISTGEAVAEELDLGEVPADRLRAAAEESLGAIVLMADTEAGISGAACRLPEMNAIIINRNEPPSRRHYDLAHEIFHLLTWEAMPPEHIDGSNPKNKRIEQLADNFASGILMPSYVMQRYYGKVLFDDTRFIDWVNESASELKVSSIAFLWRLVNNNEVPAGVAKEISATDWLAFNGGRMKDEDTPALFSSRYLSVLSRALQKALISERRVSALLDISLDELETTFRQHKIESPLVLQ